ncbi:MAG: DUF4097 family beta strand repeat protein [Lachnospiraceae bacterium]|nr:DUF4097 family beta strand repeat protein [Lachnospiraceae bacterium]
MERMMNQSNSFDQTGQSNKEAYHTRRVGSFTCGLMLVLYGILFMVHIIQPKLNYNLIFELWPLILVFLGVEILISCTGRNQEKKKYVYDFGAVFLIFIVAFFAMVMSVVSYYNEYYDRVYSADADSEGNAGYAQTVSGSKDFAAKDINSINLSNEFWDIKVMPSEDSDIHVSYNGTMRGGEDTVRLNQVQDSIVMEIREVPYTVNIPFWHSVNYGRIGGEAVLYLPENDTIVLNLNNESGDMLLKDVSCKTFVLDNEYGNVNLENVVCAADFSYENNSGNIRIQNISCEGLKLNNDYGNANLNNIYCKGFDFNNDSGNIKIENSSCGDFDLNNGYGDLKFNNTSFGTFVLNNDAGRIDSKNITVKDADIKTNSGNIEIVESSVDVARIDTDSASMTFDGVLAGSLNIKSAYGNVNLKDIDVKTETTISSDSGNVNVRYKDKPDDISFDIRSEYGNIRLGLQNVQYEHNSDTEKRGIIGNGTYNIRVETDSSNITLE